MNPITEGIKEGDPVVPRRNGAVSQRKMWQWDFRYVRIVLILGAIGCSLSYWHERFEHPMTDDAYIQADVIRVAAQVNGPLKKIEVADNQKVRQGQELLEIDPEPFRIAVDKARADHLQALQDLESLRDEVENTRATLALAEADAQRAEKLFETKVISTQELQDSTTKRDQAKARFLKAQHTLQLQGRDNAGVLAAKAALDNAQLNLSYTRVIAEKGGMVTNLNLPAGNYIKIGEPLFTMVTDDSWRAIAYFKETVLHKIRPGQKAKIELVAYPDHVFHGVVQGVGWGITQQDVVLSDSLPTVAPTVNWVRLPQRFPVRVDIIDPDPAFPLRMGQTAVVSIATTN
ncbi:MAG TPA: HlyD family secretion protein [Chthoniobacterales bacterium]|nr:HlyD family secretion protein [Chthoniobacterales bacterium]